MTNRKLGKKMSNTRIYVTLIFNLNHSRSQYRYVRGQLKKIGVLNILANIHSNKFIIIYNKRDKTVSFLIHIK